MATKVKVAIAASDPRPLFGYTEELAKLSKAVVAALKKPRPAMEQLSSEFHLNATQLRQSVTEFCDGVDKVNSLALRYVVLVNRLGDQELIRPFLEKQGFGGALQEGTRLEGMLTLVAAAGHALANATRSGRSAEFRVAAESIARLRTLVSPRMDEARPPT